MPWVQTNDVETYYETEGDGPPVVFVHGAILDHLQWRPQIEGLSSDYTVYAYDVRGHGRTGASSVEHYTVELFADDLAAYIEALGLDRPVVCGLSLGGCISQVYASRHPDGLSGLVLADTFTPEIQGRGEWLQRVMLLRATVPFVRLVGYERVESVLVWLQERLQRGVSGDYEAVQRLRSEGPGMRTEEFGKVIRALVDFRETEISYSSITVPTLVLYGENEPGFIRSHVPRLESLLPDVSVRMVPGAGHASNLDNPEFFNSAVMEYLGEIGYSG